jgi:hypothetical protein
MKIVIIILSFLIVAFAGADTTKYFVGGQIVLEDMVQGLAYEKQVFDDAGNMLNDSAWDAKGKPDYLYNETHEVRYKYQGKNCTEATEWGIHGEPTADGKGIHRSVFTYDERGNPIGEAYWGIHGEARAVSGGVHRSESVYDEKNRQISYREFSPDEEPLLDREGYSSYRTSYSEDGRTATTEYFGVKDEPVLTNWGFHIVKSTTDQWDDVLEEYHFGLSGEPVLNIWGYHCVRYTYDGNFQQTSEKYYDVNMKEISLPDESGDK